MITDIVSQFRMAPFLFIGAGLSRRYLGLPSWEGLLEHFARRLDNDPYVYRKYLLAAERQANPADVLPLTASLIESDFNNQWFKNPSFRTENESLIEAVSQGASPFKMSICDYILAFKAQNPIYREEIEKLSMLPQRSISGIITTNYDVFLDEISDNYTTYVGQQELIFSPIQGIAEIYKIHGSVLSPNSIVINEKDYQEFLDKSKYLASKLLTIFMEYPIIFLGYSVKDPNIRQILESIVDCLPEEKLSILQERFIFIEYDAKAIQPKVSPSTFMFEHGKSIRMTQISLSDFSLLYDSLATFKTRIPVRVMRAFKKEFYDFTLTNTPSAKLRLANIEDAALDGEDLAVVFGKFSEVGLFGLKGISANEWYRDIILDDLTYSADEMLDIAFPALLPKTSLLPVYKHLAKSTREFANCIQHAYDTAGSFDSIISKSLRNARNKNTFKSIEEIAGAPELSLEKRTRLMAGLPEELVDVRQLFSYLSKLFIENPNILETSSVMERTNLRRLIRVYDYMQYKIKEGPQV